MSVQSDCEMIFIHCIEEYKKNYFVSTDEANVIFQNSHIFEKILLQKQLKSALQSATIPIRKML